MLGVLCVFLISPWAEFSSFFGIFYFYHRQVAPRKRNEKGGKERNTNLPSSSSSSTSATPKKQTQTKTKEEKRTNKRRAETARTDGKQSNSPDSFFSFGGVSVSLQMLEERNELDDFQKINTPEIVSPFLLAGNFKWSQIHKFEPKPARVGSFVPLHSHTLATHLHVHPVRHT